MTAPEARPPGTARRVRVRGGLNVSVLSWGEMTARTPLLCLPGLVRTGGDFAGLAARHCGTRLVLAPDYPGRGASDRAWLWRRYLPERILKDVIDVVAAFGLRRVVAIGTSLGAVLAMGLATVRPRMVTAAVLNDAGPEIDPSGMGFVHRFVGTQHRHANLDAAAAYLRDALPWLSLRTDHEWREMARLTFREAEGGTWVENWDRRIARGLDRGVPGDLWDLFAPLARIPALLVRGGTSNILSAATAHRMRERFPRMAYVELPGVGHAPTLSEPGLAGTVDAFIGAQA
ncbi:alpha/beta fold hydrolase [Elioraea sp.]|uniref:alpha/beta fold hydrolase n=1 Tax=Elioraea sp. TaxID=2185103 RepID=UPI0025BAEC18|nr:alpha/beta fold hydrolase [Elioraea sp.]